MKASSTGSRASRARVTAAGSSTYLPRSSSCQLEQVGHTAVLPAEPACTRLEGMPAQLMSGMQCRELALSAAQAVSACMDAFTGSSDRA